MKIFVFENDKTKKFISTAGPSKVVNMGSKNMLFFESFEEAEHQYKIWSKYFNLSEFSIRQYWN